MSGLQASVQITEESERSGGGDVIYYELNYLFTARAEPFILLLMERAEPAVAELMFTRVSGEKKKKAKIAYRNEVLGMRDGATRRSFFNCNILISLTS